MSATSSTGAIPLRVNVSLSLFDGVLEDSEPTATYTVSKTAAFSRSLYFNACVGNTPVAQARAVPVQRAPEAGPSELGGVELDCRRQQGTRQLRSRH
jgi:hypothetical protein